MNGLPPYSNIQVQPVPPDQQAEYIIQKQNEDQIQVQVAQAQAAAAQPPKGQNG